MSNRQDDALPELPEPIYGPDTTVDEDEEPGAFTAAQMREYAQSAIASLQARLDAAERMLCHVHKEIATGGLYAGLWLDVDKFMAGRGDL